MKETFRTGVGDQVEDHVLEAYIGRLGLSWERAKDELLMPRLIRKVEQAQDLRLWGRFDMAVSHNFGPLCMVPKEERSALEQFRQQALSELYALYGAQLGAAKALVYEDPELQVMEQRLLIPTVSGVGFIEISHLTTDTLESIAHELQIVPLDEYVT